MSSNFDLVVIGGGIVGAGIFRDAALHGLKTLIIDKKDFSSQTSQSSSKMLHGGIRYLETMDFALISESLHEKALWLKLAPHLCREQAFFLPIYNDSQRPLWMMRVGLGLYDLLSGRQNTPHKIYNKQQVLKEMPELKSEGLKGAGVYHDAIVEDAKLTLEVIYDGLKEKGCSARNYCELIDVKPSSQNITLKCRDSLTHEITEIKTRDLIFATGPFTDHVLKQYPNIPWTPQLAPSKGSHLWIKKERLPIHSSLVMTPKDGRVIFVIPQRGVVLVGTTEIALKEENYFDLKPSPLEEQYLLDNLNEYFPKLLHGPLGEADILGRYAGVRPLVREGGGKNLGKIARHHKVFWPQSNIGVIIGGKYTTFRLMAQDILGPLMKRHRIAYNPQATLRPLRQKSLVLPFEPVELSDELLAQISAKELVRTPEDLWQRRLGVPHNLNTSYQR